MIPSIITVLAFATAAGIHSTAPEPIHRHPDDGTVIGGLYASASLITMAAWLGLHSMNTDTVPPAAEQKRIEKDRTMTIEDDRKFMGTPDEAKAGLIEAARVYRSYQGAHIDSAKGHRQREIQSREAGARLTSAALLWLWHEENPAELPARLRGNVTEATLRLIAGAFRRDGEQLSSDRRPRFSIPTRPTEDDDCVVIDSLKEAAARIEALEAALRYARPLLVKYAYTQGNRADFVREVTAPIDAALTPESSQ